MVQPSLSPLSRLQVSDGLLLTADRWEMAHGYHRQRQNMHYQALHQAGIVCGLGVRPIPDPQQMASQYRDGCWVQIQPGMAIDQQGNPIIVPNPVDYHITPVAVHQAQEIYLTLSYVDPDGLKQPSGTAVVQEMFRLEETQAEPGDDVVELCRILLDPKPEGLRSPTNVLRSGLNEINLCHRQWARVKPCGTLQVGQFSSNREVEFKECFQGLFEAMDGLYPQLVGSSMVTLPDTVNWSNVHREIDLLYLPFNTFVHGTADLQRHLFEYIGAGGTVVLEVAEGSSGLNQLTHLQYELRSSVARMESVQQSAHLRDEVTSEVQALEEVAQQQVDALKAPLQAIAQQVPVPPSVDFEQSGQLGGEHPLRSQPFRFVQFPHFHFQALDLLNWGGLVLVIGNLSAGWGHNPDLALPRESLRSAQELGINLLHFAWRRRQISRWLEPPQAPPISRQALFDKLGDS